MNNLTVAHWTGLIFVDSPMTKAEKAEGLLNAKLTLVADIIKIRGRAGFVPSGSYFDDLMDMNIDLLHREVIIAEDEVFEKCKTA